LLDHRVKVNMSSAVGLEYSMFFLLHCMRKESFSLALVYFKHIRKAELAGIRSQDGGDV